MVAQRVRFVKRPRYTLRPAAAIYDTAEKKLAAQPYFYYNIRQIDMAHCPKILPRQCGGTAVRSEHGALPQKTAAGGAGNPAPSFPLFAPLTRFKSERK